MKQKMLILFTFFVLVSGCTFQTHNGENSIRVKDECIPPLVEGSYPIEFDNSKVPLYALPGKPWQEVLRLPEKKVKDAISIIDSLYLWPGSKDEIWIVRQYYSKEDITTQKVEFWIYNISTGTLKELNISLDIFSQFWGITFASDGTIWGRGTSDHFDQIFGKYDEAQQKFVKINFDLPLPQGINLYDKTKNIFWIFSEKNGGGLEKIYKVMLGNKKIMTYPVPKQLENIGSSVELAPDGSFYMVVIKSYLPTENLIMKFSPETQEVEEIKNTIKNDEYFDSLFFDHSGNMWLNDHSKMSADGEWYQVLRSPIFITDRFREINHQYVWGFPRIVYESSNGFLWFQSISGLAWHDPQKEKWCWVTTERVSLLEDNQQTMWLIVNERLYKYVLKP